MASLTQVKERIPMKKLDLSQYHDKMKDVMFRWRTAGLFYETRRNNELADKYPPIFTLKPSDLTVEGKKYISMKKLYMQYEHVPGYEYDFATEVFGSWDCWQTLYTSPLIRPHIDDWRAEYEVKLRSDALKQIIATSRGEDQRGFQAAKFVANGEYRDTSKRGRPSNVEVERERKIQAGVRDSLSADMERLGLAVVNGGK